MRKILITGATGFVGGQLTRHFSQLGYDVHSLSRTYSPTFNLLKVSTYHQYTQFFKFKHKFDICIHCTANTGSGNKAEIYKTNVGLLQQTISSTRCNHHIYISSASVYGFNSGMHKETDPTPLHNLSHYGLSKLKAEELIIKETARSIVHVIRPRAIYGTHDRVLLPKILGMKKGNITIIPTAKSSTSSMTNILNLIEFIDHLIIKNKQHSPIVNFSDDKLYCLHDVIKSIHRSLDPNRLILQIPNSFARNILRLKEVITQIDHTQSNALKYLKSGFLLNTNRLHKEFKFTPKFNFHDSLNDITRFIKGYGEANYILNPGGSCWASLYY